MRRAVIVIASLLAFMGAMLVVTMAQADVPEGIATGLISCYDFDEESGTRYDAYGSKHLTDNNTVGFSGTGVQGASAHFVGANSEYLSRANWGTDLSAGDDATIVMWVKPDNYVSAAYYLFLRNGTTGTYLRFNQQSSSLSRTYLPSTLVQLSQTDTEWNFLAARFDNSEDISNGRYQTTYTIDYANTADFQDYSDDTLYIGSGSASASFYSGDIDILAIWERYLSNDELDYLYNSGDGVSCADMIAASNPTATATTGPTATSTASPTPVPSATVTPDVRTTEVVTLPSGSTMVINREFTYGDMALIGLIGLVFASAVIYGIVRITNLWLH